MYISIYKPRSFGDIMFKLGENINHLVLVMIVGVTSIAVSYIGDIAKSMQLMALSIQELNVKMGSVSESVRDHEARIRLMEQTKQQRR